MIWPFRRKFDRALIERDADELIERHTALRAYGQARTLAMIEGGMMPGSLPEARPAGHWARVRYLVGEKTGHDYLDSATRRLEPEHQRRIDQANRRGP